MPTNAAVLSQLMNEGIYGKESLARIIPWLRDALGAGFEAGSDALQIFHGSVTALAAGGEIRTNGAVKIYAVHIDSPSGSTTDVVVKFFNTSTASTALTTTSASNGKEALAIKCIQKQSATVVFLPQSPVVFDAAASYAVVSATSEDSAAAAGAAPTVTVLYA
jgi:hypothetical protein